MPTWLQVTSQADLLGDSCRKTGARGHKAGSDYSPAVLQLPAEGSRASPLPRKEEVAPGRWAHSHGPWLGRVWSLLG